MEIWDIERTNRSLCFSLVEHLSQLSQILTILPQPKQYFNTYSKESFTISNIFQSAQQE